MIECSQYKDNHSKMFALPRPETSNDQSHDQPDFLTSMLTMDDVPNPESRKEERVDVGTKRKRPSEEECVPMPSNMSNDDGNVFQFELSVSKSFPELKSIVEMFQCTGKDVNIYMCVDNRGISVYNWIFDSAGYIVARMNVDMFSSFAYSSSEESYSMVLKVSQLHEQLKRISILAPSSVIITGSTENLEIQGIYPERAPVTLTLCQIQGEEFEEQTPPVYPASLQFESKLVCTAIDQMIGPIFTIRLDTTRSQLLFYSSEDNQTIELPLSIKPEEMSVLAERPGASSYEVHVKKSHFAPVLKAQKIHTMLRLSFIDVDSPMKIQYVLDNDDIGEEDDVREKEYSSVSVFIIGRQDESGSF